MKTKIVKSFIIMLVSSFFLFNFSSANFGTLVFKGFGEISEAFNEMHFFVKKSGNSKGTDFGGFLITLNVLELDGKKTINIGGNNSVECEKRISGLYFNSVRGNMIRALNQEVYDFIINFFDNAGVDINGDGVFDELDIGYTMNGGFYYDCDGDNVEEFSVIGEIEYNSSATSDKIFSIQAGRKYIYTGANSPNSITGANFTNNFQLYEGAVPMGFLYDSTYGISFVGGEMTDKSCMNKLINDTNDTAIIDYVSKLSTTPHVLEFSNIDDDCVNRNYGETFAIVRSVIGFMGGYYMSSQNKHGGSATETSLGQYRSNLRGQRAFSMGGKTVNLSSVINSLRKNVASLCRDRWETTPYTINNITTSKNLYCIKGDNVTLERDLTKKNEDTTIIIKGGGDLVINKNQAEGDSRLNVFVDEGNIQIGSRLNQDGTGHLADVDGKGMYTDTASDGITKGIYLKGDYFTKGLLIGSDDKNYNLDHKLYVYGRMAFFNTFEDPNDVRVDLVENVLGTDQYNDVIKLGKLFNWRCLHTGEGNTDGVVCDNNSDRWKGHSMIVQPDGKRSKLLDG